MPVNNNFYGVYKFGTVRTHNLTLGVNKNPYIISNLGKSDDMSANPEFFMQGTPLNKVLNIEGVTEKFSINAPILVPQAGRTLSDGLLLFHDLVRFQYDTNNIPYERLPILTGASITIGDQASVSLNLESDGNPNNSLNVYEVTTGATARSYINTTGLNYGGRRANKFDFYVDFGGIKFFVETGTIQVTVNTKKNNFLGVYPEDYRVPTDSLNNGVYQGDDSYSGWQFPFLSLGGVSIVVSGTAAVSIDNNTGAAVNYKYPSALINSSVNDLLNASNVTLQPSGVFKINVDNFNIFYAGNGALSAVLPTQFGINKTIITANKFKISGDLMTTDFTANVVIGID